MLRYFIVFICVILNLYGNDIKPAVQDCKVICEKCGFEVWQTKDYFENLKTSYKKEDAYYIAMDDLVYYFYEAEKYLETNGISVNFYSPSIEKCPILAFGKDSLEVGKIDNPFIFILYEKGKKPYVIQDIMIPEYEINTYFNIANLKRRSEWLSYLREKKHLGLF